MSTGVAGLMPINCKRVTNVDLSSLISGHTEYSNNLQEILKFVGLNTRDIEMLNDDGVLKKSCSGLPHTSSTEAQPVSNTKIILIIPTTATSIKFINEFFQQNNLGMRASKSDMCLSTVSHRQPELQKDFKKLSSPCRREL